MRFSAPGILLCCLLLPVLLVAAKEKGPSPEKERLRQKRVGSFMVYGAVKIPASYGSLMRRLEDARKSFFLHFPELKHSSVRPGVIRIFSTREEYLEYVGKEYEWSGGIWNGKEMAISPPSEKMRSSQEKEWIRTVVFHEGFHFFLDTSLNSREAGLWFHEGGARFFEGQDNKGRIRPDDAQLAQLAAKVKESKLPLADLMMMAPEEFQEKSALDLHYTLSYALIYYLLKGAPAEKSPYAAFPHDYLRLLMQKKNNEAALQELAEKYPPESLEKEFRAFWASPSRIRRSVRYAPKGGK